MASLTVDSRVGHTPTESRAARAESLIRDLRRLGVPAKLGELRFGDVSFIGQGPEVAIRVGIELKTITGLLTDMVTGRFAGTQVPGMQRAYARRYLLLQGAMRPAIHDGLLEVPRHGSDQWWSPSPRIMYIDFVKFVDDIGLRAGFEIRRSWNRTDTLYHLAGIFLGWQVAWDKHKGLKSFDESGVVVMQEPSVTRLWAKALPKVGWERSEAVDRRFETPLDLAQANQREWEKIPGVSKIIAARAWKVIRGLK